MAEIPDRLPGEVILASYSNDIRDRALMRYADRTARDASNPVPQPGDMAWILTLGILEIYDGAAWRVFTDDEQLAAIDSRLDVFENRGASAFEPAEVTLPFAGTVLAQVVLPPVPGDYLINMQALLRLIPDVDGQNHAADMFLRVDDVKQEEWAIFVRPDTSIANVDIESRINFTAFYPLVGMAGGEEIDLWGELNTTVDGTASVTNRQIRFEQWAGGLL